MGIGVKRSETGGGSSSAPKLIQQVKSLFAPINTVKDGEKGANDGIVGEKESLFTLEIEDSELIKLSNNWESEFKFYDSKIAPRRDENYKYWKGDLDEDKTLGLHGVDNIVFESVETLLPLISRENPEPLVSSDKTPDGTFVADNTAKILAKVADESRLKIKIKKVARHWMLSFLGCVKMGWDEKKNNMYFQVVLPQHLILDPRGEFDGAQFCGRYIGEYKTASAQELADMFPDHANEITEAVEGKMGTTLSYHEWWCPEYVFWRFKDIILEKRPNPFWNESTTTTSMDEYGVESEVEAPAVNHLVYPTFPHSFLTVFNTGEGPFDETSLIEQVKPLQDIVNKRIRQIDKNADDTNNGWIFNNQFDQNKANRALAALKKGGAIIAPTVTIGESVTRLQAPPLAPFVYEDLLDKREQIRNIMGVRGSSAQGIMNERTVRGKIEIKGQDVDRLSLIVEHIEQMVDHLYNLAVQTIYVYYGPEQAAAFLGPEDGAKYIALLKADPNRKLTVSVKEGSMIPQDPLMRRNEAIDLYTAGVLDPETLFEKLDFANPKELAQKVITYRVNPQSMVQPTGAPPGEPGVMGAPGEVPTAPAEVSAGLPPIPSV